MAIGQISAAKISSTLSNNLYVDSTKCSLSHQPLHIHLLLLRFCAMPCRAVPDVRRRGVPVDPACITQYVIMCSIVLASIYGMLGSR